MAEGIDSCKQDGDQTRLDARVLHILGAAQECDANLHELLGLLRRDDVWHVSRDEFKVVHDIFQEVLRQESTSSATLVMFDEDVTAPRKLVESVENSARTYLKTSACFSGSGSWSCAVGRFCPVARRSSHTITYRMNCMDRAWLRSSRRIPSVA